MIGAVYAVATVLLARELGAAPLTALIVTGQLVCSVALDHFGWVGFTEHAAGLGRIVSRVLMIAGLSNAAAALGSAQEGRRHSVRLFASALSGCGSSWKFIDFDFVGTVVRRLVGDGRSPPRRCSTATAAPGYSY